MCRQESKQLECHDNSKELRHQHLRVRVAVREMPDNQVHARVGVRGVNNATHPGPRNDPEGREAASPWSLSMPACEKVIRGSGERERRGFRSENGKVECQRGQTRKGKIHEAKYEKEMGIAALAVGGTGRILMRDTCRSRGTPRR